MTGGLVAAVVLDGQGGSRSLTWSEVEAWRPEDGILWIHLDLQEPSARSWIENGAGLESGVGEALLTEDPRPRATILGAGVLAILRGVNFEPGSVPEDMVALRCWVESRRIVTGRHRPVRTVQDLLQSLERGRGPATVGELMACIADRLVERTQDIVEEATDQVSALEEEMLGELGADLRERIAALRRRVITLQRNLVPQRDALARLQGLDVEWLHTDDRLHLSNSHDGVARYIETLRSVGERAIVTQDELGSRQNEELNRRMFFLSIVAAIFLPLSFLTGLLGINVGGIPGSEDRDAFGIVSVGLVVIVILQVWYFRRNRWL